MLLHHCTPSCREPGVHTLLIWLGVIAFAAPSVEAEVAPRSPKIALSHSADFPEMVFVLYGIKADDPWAKGTRVDSTPPKIVPTGTVIELPFWQEFAVLAVPRALAEKAKGASDPTWLEPS